ncbi:MULTISPECIES: LuxR C-terminal-related transcriptional regulator [unclassified Exiguobacterium]|uniref:response regulator transcription factor n=1 Tax=unclassified Exiguobacterium TaxID=2644629 RepID=UPI0020375439|nr:MULTISPECIES: LuxR C-terminal-related transcriptional regulator [unclassified Exiguobacterium]
MNIQTKLSGKETEVAGLIAKGYKDVEIAKTLFISQRRVGEIVFNIKQKWGIQSRVELGIIAFEYKLIQSPLARIKS